MKNWYDSFQNPNQKTASALKSDDGDLSSVRVYSSGLDAFLTGADLSGDDLSPLYSDRRASADVPNRVRVASVGTLKGFTRLASNTLVRHCDQDLWELKQGDDGEYYIERLFDDNGEPLKV